ncbi:MAG: hypothetical protein GXO90_05975, partial [FCB group bacterium]|nr:hypothetical protein [FCB group bacterium]
GGPNSRKHPIDYEFGEYDRNNLIYRFAALTDAQVEERIRIPEPVEGSDAV